MPPKKRIRLALMAGGIVFLVSLACRFFQQAVTPTPRPVIPVDQLQFTDMQTGSQFRTLDGCIRNLAGSSWKGGSYELVGNFYEAGWCTGKGARADCQIAGSSIDNRDQHVIQLNTLFYPQNNSRVFGLGLQSLWVPKSTGWGASFAFSEKGEGISGDGWGVVFRQYLTSSQPVDATVDLGWTYGYIIHGPNQTSIDLTSELSLRQDLAQYLKGPEAMRDLGLKNIKALAADVEGQLQAHKIMGCDLGPYQNDGIPPACNPRPMTAAEEAGQIELARKYFTNEETLLTEHYQEMYAAWMAAFPLNECWPE
jgi:hypothetical protein